MVVRATPRSESPAHVEETPSGEPTLGNSVAGPRTAWKAEAQVCTVADTLTIPAPRVLTAASGPRQLGKPHAGHTTCMESAQFTRQ